MILWGGGVWRGGVETEVRHGSVQGPARLICFLPLVYGACTSVRPLIQIRSGPFKELSVSNRSSASPNLVTTRKFFL